MENFQVDNDNNVEKLALIQRITENMKENCQKKMDWSEDIHKFVTRYECDVYGEVIKKEFGEAFPYTVSETLEIMSKQERAWFDWTMFIDNRVNFWLPGEPHPFVLNNAYRVHNLKDSSPKKITLSKRTKIAKRACEFYSLGNLYMYTNIYWNEELKRADEVIVIKNPFQIFKEIKYNNNFQYEEIHTDSSVYYSIPVEQEALKELIIYQKRAEELN